MSLIRQIWLLMLGTVLLAFLGSVTVAVESARNYLETQLQLKNADNATSLALALSQQKGDPELMNLTMSAQFDTGFYRRIRLVGADGAERFAREATVGPQAAPAWFARIVPIASQPGIAQVSDGWRALGRVEVESHSAYAVDELWRSSVRSALALAVVGLIAGGLGSLVIGRIRKPIDSTVGQAQALVKGEFVVVEEPGVPELQRLTQAMNAMVERLRVAFQAQAAQLDSLHRQANCDALTGLANRGHFLGQLGAALHREDGTAEGGLVLLRVLDLAGINRALGHAGADRVITTISEALSPYTERVELGRLGLEGHAQPFDHRVHREREPLQLGHVGRIDGDELAVDQRLGLAHGAVDGLADAAHDQRAEGAGDQPHHRERERRTHAAAPQLVHGKGRVALDFHPAQRAPAVRHLGHPRSRDDRHDAGEPRRRRLRPDRRLAREAFLAVGPDEADAPVEAGVELGGHHQVHQLLVALLLRQGERQRGRVVRVLELQLRLEVVAARLHRHRDAADEGEQHRAEHQQPDLAYQRHARSLSIMGPFVLLFRSIIENLPPSPSQALPASATAGPRGRPPSGCPHPATTHRH